MSYEARDAARGKADARWSRRELLALSAAAGSAFLASQGLGQIAQEPRIGLADAHFTRGEPFKNVTLEVSLKPFKHSLPFPSCGGSHPPVPCGYLPITTTAPLQHSGVAWGLPRGRGNEGMMVGLARRVRQGRLTHWCSLDLLDWQDYWRFRAVRLRGSGELVRVQVPKWAASGGNNPFSGQQLGGVAQLVRAAES